MSDHSAVLRDLADHWASERDSATCRLAADVLDAIPDKDDPVGWVKITAEDNIELSGRLKGSRLANDNLTTDLIQKRHWIDAQGSEMSKLVDKFEMQQDELRDLRALRDAIPGGDKLAIAEWAVKIAAELMDEWEEGSTHADTYYIVEHWWRACPPSVRAALRGEA